MAGIIRIRALEALAATIERLVPQLEGLVRAGHAEHPKKQEWPTLTIIPTSWRFFPDQDDTEHSIESASKAVINVGRHEAVVQLIIAARSSRKRYELEHAITQVFVSQEGHPGTLPDLFDALIAYEMDESAWADEMAFDKVWRSIMTVTCIIPALVERGAVYTINEIRVSLTEDLLTPFASLPSSEIETVSIDENGDLTKV